MKKTLLYTGSPRDDIIQEWRNLGFEVLVAPVFSYQKLPFTLPNLEEISFCIISSQRTVHILKPILPELVQRGVAFYVVGQKTASMLQKFGVSIREIGEKGFLAIKNKLPENQLGIFFGAKELAEPATEYLNWNPMVVHVPVYQQHKREILITNKIDGIITTSPKGVEIMGENEAWKELPLFVLGDSSAKKADEMGFSLVFKCKTPQLENLAEAIQRCFLGL